MRAGLAQGLLTNAATVDVHASLLFQRLRDLLRGHGTEELAGHGGATPEHQLYPVDLPGELVQFVFHRSAARGSLFAQLRGAIHLGPGRLYCEATRDEIVAGESVSDVDHLAGHAVLKDIVEQNHLHGCFPARLLRSPECRIINLARRAAKCR